MGAFSLKLFWEDIWQQLRCNKRQTWLCVLCAVVGIILGIVLFNTANYNWWYCNRYDFAIMLLCGGFFKVFFHFLLTATVFCLFLCLLGMWHWTPFLCYPLIVIISIYFGANCCAIFTAAGVIGILYLLCVLLVSQIVNTLCCFLTLCLPTCRRTFSESYFAMRGVCALQVASVVVRVLLLFLFARLFSAAI